MDITPSHLGLTDKGRVLHILPAAGAIPGPARCGTTGVIWYALRENPDLAQRLDMAVCRRCIRLSETDDA